MNVTKICFLLALITGMLAGIVVCWYLIWAYSIAPWIVETCHLALWADLNAAETKDLTALVYVSTAAIISVLFVQVWSWSTLFIVRKIFPPVLP